MDKNGGAGALFNAGRLQEAIAAATAAVRKAPSDLSTRLLLAELLLFEGSFERVDALLNTLVAMDPALGIGVAEFRQLVCAEVIRRQLFSQGRVPDFIGAPTASQRAALAAVVAWREGNMAAVASACAEAEAARPRASGQMDDAPFDDWRDADDLLCGSLEVLTTTGKYFWIPFELVTALQPHPARRPRDLFLAAGQPFGCQRPPGRCLPAGALSSARHGFRPMRLGRATEWIDAHPGVVRGAGPEDVHAGPGRRPRWTDELGRRSRCGNDPSSGSPRLP